MVGRLLSGAMLALGLAASVADAMPGIETAARWLSPKFRSLDEARRSLEQQLGTAAPEPPRNLTERLGFHSGFTARPDQEEWIRVDFGVAERLDAVVLVAAASNAGGVAAPGYGFPLRFKVELLTPTGRAGQADDVVVLADYTQTDFPNPGALPVYLPAQGRQAHSVRLTATRLFAENGQHFLALGEMVVLQGKLNLAADLPLLGARRINARSSAAVMPVWGKMNLVDGQTLLGPPVGIRTSPTYGFQSKPVIIATPDPELALPTEKWVQVDLGVTRAIQEVRLFPAHPIHDAHRQGYLFPPRFRIDVSDTGDFSAATKLADSNTLNFAAPGDNVVTFRGRGTAGRFVRLTTHELSYSSGKYGLALAEMQVWSGGENAALGATVQASDWEESKGWSRAALVDGFTSQANILDWGDWWAGLSHRREIVDRLTDVQRRRTGLLQRFELMVTAAGMAGLSLALAGLVLWGWRQRRLRQRELALLRQRISQDLHDDIGSSLGSIALISDGLMKDCPESQPMRADLAQIRTIARQTVDSMRDIARLVKSDTYGGADLPTYLKEISARMLYHLPHTLELDALGAAERISIDRQRDLVLMFKEALHNVLQHAQATHVFVSLTRSGRMLRLTVRDNGRGFDSTVRAPGRMGLANLRRRAVRLGGELSVTSAPGAGTTVIIAITI
jgi:signal transduction histidine kinase